MRSVSAFVCTIFTFVLILLCFFVGGIAVFWCSAFCGVMLLFAECPLAMTAALAMLPMLFYVAAVLHFFFAGSRFEVGWLRFRGAAARLLLPILLIFCMTVVSLEDYQTKLTVPASTSLQLAEYVPFEPQSKLARLPHPASLQLSDALPVLDGATALVPVYAAFVEAVYPHEDTMQYDFQQAPLCYSNTIGGYEALFEGQRDIMFGAYPSEEQLAYAETCGAALTFTPIGREGFVFFVNATNPVDNLSSAQLRAIYSGQITNWHEVGGRNQKIEAFQRNAGSGSQSALLRFMGDTPLMQPPQETVQDMMSGIIYRAADYKNHSNAIGFSFRYYAQDMIADKGIKLLSIDGVAPTVEHIRSGAYPLTSEFYAVTTQHSCANSQRLIDWILSPEGQALIEATGYAGV